MSGRGADDEGLEPDQIVVEAQEGRAGRWRRGPARRRQGGIGMPERRGKGRGEGGELRGVLTYGGEGQIWPESGRRRSASELLRDLAGIYGHRRRRVARRSW